MRQIIGRAAAAALFGSVAVSAVAATMPAADRADQKLVDHDFGKVSVDGTRALHDIREGRVAIFDGNISGAKAEIAQAVASLNKAQSDETVFTKAESEFRGTAGVDGKTTPSAAPSAPPSTTPVQWLPVGGAMTLGENYTVTPQKTAGVAKANDKLAKGDQKAAIDELRLANVDVDFLVEVAPLKATIAGVKQAEDELNGGKYYEANQSLKAVEDGMRFYTQTLVADPQKANAPAKTSG